MKYRFLVTFSQAPHIAAFLSKLKCDDISCQIELYTPKVEELCVSYIGFKPSDKALKDDIAKIAYSCGALSVQEFAHGRSNNKRNRKNSSGSIKISSQFDKTTV